MKASVTKELHVKARVNLGGLNPGDVEVQLFHGVVDSLGEIPKPRTTAWTRRPAASASRSRWSTTKPQPSPGQKPAERAS